MIISIDNGVSGTIAVNYQDSIRFMKTPVIKQQSYTKKKQQISRLDFKAFLDFLTEVKNESRDKIIILLERPFTGQNMQTVASAMRCLEAQLIAIEWKVLAFRYVDSGEWQKVMLPKGLKGKELKTISAEIGCRLFPEFADKIKKHGDADSLLMMEWYRRSTHG